MSLKWKVIDDYYCASDVGGYTVCMVSVFASIWYEAWHGKRFIDRVEDVNSKAMRDACQADWDKRQEKAA